jgi:organic radical activating enzyme
VVPVPFFPVHETFRATLQGEGFWVGIPVDFIRLYGCPVSCPWCDTGYESGGKGIAFSLFSLSDLLSGLVSPTVVISGGEPFVHKHLPVLCQAILDTGRRVHVETSGAFWLQLPEQVWVTLSPKNHVSSFYPVHPRMWSRANELKIVISDGTEIDFYLQFFEELQVSCEIFLQPEWKTRDHTIPLAVRQIHQYIGMSLRPMRLSLQLHKLLDIP